MSKKEAIVSAALTLLIENGVHATPMSAIAKAAKTGMGTIYNYFPTKEVLINDIYVQIKQEEENLFSSLAQDEPVKTRFEQYYMATVNFYMANPHYFKFIDQLYTSPIITSSSREMGYKAINEVITLLKQGQKDRIFKNLEVTELLQFIGGSIMAFLRAQLTHGQLNKYAIQNQLKMVWDAIKE